MIAKDLDLISLEESVKLDDLITELRLLPEDYSKFSSVGGHEMPDELIQLLEKSGSWMSRLWPLFLMLSEVEIQRPGSSFNDYDDDFFGQHEDMIP